MLALRFPKSQVRGVDIRPPNPTELHLKDGIFDNLTRLTGDVYDDDIIASAIDQTPKGGTCIVLGTHLCGYLSVRAVDLIAEYPDVISAAIVAPCCLMRQKKPSKYSKGTGWGHDTTKMARIAKIDPFALWLQRLRDRAPVPDEDKTIVTDQDMISTKNSFIAIRNPDLRRSSAALFDEKGELMLCREIAQVEL
mmetsp:Transcript_25635/g.52158  ORF Transcript_25635/g.52158 Transcript_25635/m.52158 type:complete len:194 (-) Transcript_25635:1726-2307(-)